VAEDDITTLAKLAGWTIHGPAGPFEDAVNVTVHRRAAPILRR
jgi:hypothetical protein